MRRVSTALLGVTMAFSVSGLAGAAQVPTGISHQAAIDRQILNAAGQTSGLVHTAPGYSMAEGVAAAESVELRTGTHYDAIDVFVAYGSSSSFRALSAAEEARYIEWNAPLTFFTDSSHKATQGQNVLDGEATLPDGTIVDGTGVGVAVVDSGIDGTHPDLASRMGGNVKIVCSTPQFVAIGATGGFSECLGPKQAVPLADTDTPSGGGHGTHVAGIVAGTGAASAGKYHGAAPGATLYGVSVGTAIAVENGLDGLAWVLENHDQVTPAIKVVSNSWGSGYSAYDKDNAPFHKATWLLQEALINDGVTVVFAAGNASGNGSAPTTTAECLLPMEGLVCVANYDDRNSGTRSGAIASSSSRGQKTDSTTWPDISAPGTSIVSTCRATLPVCWANTGQITDPPNSYSTLSGTSMAAPHVSGIIAQLYQVDPNLTPAEIENVIEDTAYKFTFGSAYESDPYNPDNTSSFEKGHGLIDVLAAVRALLEPLVTTAQPPTGP